MFSCTSGRSIALCESGSAQMRRGKYHIVWTSPLLYGEAVQNVTRSQRRDTQTHTWSWWGTARSSLYAVYLYFHSQCITARRTNARLKLTLARDIGVVVEEEGMVNCSPLDSCSGQWRSWQRWGMATSSTWLLVRRTRHHRILYIPSHPPQCGYCKEIRKCVALLLSSFDSSYHFIATIQKLHSCTYITMLPWTRRESAM